MSAPFFEHGEDPNGMARRSNRQRLMGGEADYADENDRRRSFAAERDADVERNAPVQQAEPGPDPYALDGMERMLYVGQDNGGEEQFNDMWMRDHWHGRQGGAGGGLLQARGDFGGSPIEDDLLKADRGHVFQERTTPGPSAPAAGWDRLNQGWLGAFFGGIFGGKGRAFRKQQQAQRRTMVGEAFNRGGEMPEWVRNSRYGQRKWNQLLRAGRR